MKAEELWKVSDGEGVTVAVLDDGVDAATPELKGQVLKGLDLSGVKGKTDHHGTEMAALIAGTGERGGLEGLAPGSKILPIRTYIPGDLGDPSELWSEGIRYAVEQGAKVINISQGVKDADESAVAKLQQAVDEAATRDVLIFAATGNDGDDRNVPAYPSALRGVVGVSAVDKTGRVSKFSTHGPQVALASPGEDIPQRCSKADGFCSGQGTSHATALASASAALIWSKHPDWTANQVLRVMMQTTSKPKGKVPSRYIGYGIIRPAQVLIENRGDPGDPDVNPLFPDYRPGRAPSSPAAPQSPGGKESRPPGQKEDRPGEASASTDAAGEGNDALIWVAASAAAGAVVLAAAFALIRTRRSRR
ncbi:S8 family serine peptidase [Streptomyces sp. NPDC018031]|uniref:S8 family serine peptidase n=1 Tax=Streptomyces sp. NPDC018031 TaxID=3365033 RepID=UPI0037B9FF88